jgi:16S rRNA (cytosine967-C5)-methyltransferase
LRANRLRTTRAALAARLAEADVGVAPTRRAPDGLVVERGHPLRSADPAEAWFFVQDEASQLVALVAQSIAGRSVLDSCASPGGKTTAIAAAMNGAGLLVACDVRPRRVELLRQTVSASGARNVRLVQADLMRPLPFTRQFDAVILDAPCSGLGTLRRDPDLRWRRHEADLAVLAAAERVMLANAADAVRPGGRLLYATCSSEPEENEAVVDALLHARPGFAIDHIGRAAPALPADVIDARGFLRTQPHAHGLEAFFAAVLART